jgi:endo-1,4-beta-mannosidase
MNTSTSPYTAGSHFLRADGHAVVPVGVHYVPASGPDWPWRTGAEEFERAFAAMAAAGLTSVRIDLLWAAVEPAAGHYGKAHLQVLDCILDAARRQGLTLHPTLFVGGEVGDAYWDLPWAGDANPHTDPELLLRQAAQAAMLGRRWAGRPELIAWDLTDEPPFWVHRGTTTDAGARLWIRTLTEALRTADPGHLITVGTASQEVDHGPFRADITAAELDFCCVHPYPIYSPELYPDSLLSPRMTHAAAFETALARGAGRAVMVHEYGASSTQFDPDRIGAYDRLSTWSSFGRGAIGFYAWCWTDADPGAYPHAPYVRMPHETQFGLTTHDGQARPRLDSISELARGLHAVDLDGLASNGPEPDAAILVPYEYVHPYDPAAFGLQHAPAGPYRPAEPAWNADRDVKPLIRGWLNAYVLAAQAGLAAEFPRERLDGAWPGSRLVLAPAPLTSTTSSLLHLRSSIWDRVGDLHAGGGLLYLSCSAETAIPNLERFGGARIADRLPLTQPRVIRITAPFGPLSPGDELLVPAGPSGDLHLQGVLLDPTDAEVIAVDDRGHPVITLARRGPGATVICAYPIELLIANHPWDRYATALSQLYAGAAQIAGAEPIAGAEHRGLTNGNLTGPDGGVLVVTNHEGTPVAAPLRLPPAATDVTLLPLSGSEISNDLRTLTLQPFAAAAITWRQPAS